MKEKIALLDQKTISDVKELKKTLQDLSPLELIFTSLNGNTIKPECSLKHFKASCATPCVNIDFAWFQFFKLSPEIEIYGEEMRYGRVIKESVLKRVLPPNSESIRSVSNETGISDQTIRNWIEKVDKGILGEDVLLGPRQLGAAEKFNLLLEATALAEEERGSWIREKDFIASIYSYGTRSSEIL